MYRTPRGTEDILPADQPYWAAVVEAARQTARLFGFQEIVPPTFEETAVFARTSGEGTDVVDKEMYTFEDRGHTSLTLRPEVTAQVVRAYLQHGLHTQPQPLRLFYVGLPVFRYDRPQAGRLREHHQFGCEVLGEQSAQVDADLIELLWRFYEALGIRGLSVQLNSIGCPLCRPPYLEQLRAYYDPFRDVVCDDCRVRMVRNPLRLLDCKNAQCQPIANAAPRLIDVIGPECRTHWDDLNALLARRGLAVSHNARLVRGLDYYTKTVFEFWPARVGGQSTIGAGGRYDGLAEALGGRPIPGVGFATGLERVILNAREQGLALPPPPRAHVYVAYLGAAGRMASVDVLSTLRQSAIPAIGGLGDRSLKAQMRDAGASGARFVVIVGDDEVTAQAAMVKDLSVEGSAQTSVPFADLAEWVARQKESAL